MAPPGELRGKGGMVYLQYKKLCDPCWALQKWSNSLEALYKWHNLYLLQHTTVLSTLSPVNHNAGCLSQHSVDNDEHAVFSCTLLLMYTVSQKKHPLCHQPNMSDFNNFWLKYSWENLARRGHLISHLTLLVFLHYMGNKIVWIWPIPPYPPLGLIWTVMLVWRKGNINRTVSVLSIV